MPGNENCDACPKLNELQTENEALHTQIADLQRQIPRPKPNLLGAGRKPKVTPQIIKAVLMLREEGYSFGEIAREINSVDYPVKISRSTAYEIYDKYGREQSSFPSDKTPLEAVKTP